MSSPRRRVLFVVPSFAGGGGGAERVVSTLLQHLDRDRFELHLALLNGGSGFWHNLPADVTVHELGVRRMRYALPALVSLVRRVSPNVIMSTVVFANVNLLLARSLFPRHVSIVIREATTPSAFITHEARHPALFRWVYRYLYRRADKIVVLCDGMLQDLAANFAIPPDKLIRIYNPVDSENIKRAACAAPNPYQGKGPHVLAAGRLAREKGFDVLLEAMVIVGQRLPGARLTILGDGPLGPDLQRQAQRLGLDGRVYFGGFQPDPWPYLRHADVVAVPSRYEGAPNVIVEALALGTPVVATDCPGGTREIAEIAGHVRLVAPNDAATLASAIIETSRTNDRIPPGDTRLEAFSVAAAVTSYTQLFE